MPFLFTTGYDRITLGSEFAHIPIWEKPIDVAARSRALAGLVERGSPTADAAAASGAAPKAPAAS